MNGAQLIAFFKKNALSAVCVFLSLVLVGAIYFRGDALTEAEAELKEKTTLGERLAANLNHSNQLKEHYEALIAANKEIEDRFAHVSELPQNYQYFYKIQADAGVTMTVNQVTQPSTVAAPAKKVLTPIAFSVIVQGDYASVIDFLRRVEEGARISRVLACTLSASGIAGVDTGAARKISLNLSVELLGLP